MDSVAVQEMDSDAGINHAAAVLKSIAHPLRLKILCILGEGELCVQEMEKLLTCTQSNLSQHLSILRSQGVLVTHKEANRVLYRINDVRTIKIVSMMGEVFSTSAHAIRH